MEGANDPKVTKTKKPSLLSEVGDKYKLVAIQPGNYLFPGYGEYDLTRMDLETADKLYARGFPWLKLKKTT